MQQMQANGWFVDRHLGCETSIPFLHPRSVLYTARGQRLAVQNDSLHHLLNEHIMETSCSLLILHSDFSNRRVQSVAWFMVQFTERSLHDFVHNASQERQGSSYSMPVLLRITDGHATKRAGKAILTLNSHACDTS